MLDMLRHQLPLVELTADGDDSPSVVVLYDAQSKSINVCVFNPTTMRVEIFVGTSEHTDLLHRRLSHLMTCPDCNANPLAH